MYTVALDQTWERFGAHLSGRREAVACVVSTDALGVEAVSALESSLAALGYGADVATFLVLDGSETVQGPDLFAALEGLDPLCVIVADAGACALCSDAYHRPIPPDEACRVLGRDVVAFSDFASMLGDPARKRAAWALLKRLPHLDDE